MFTIYKSNHYIAACFLFNKNSNTITIILYIAAQIRDTKVIIQPDIQPS
jgi:hypothetical protein